MQDNESCTCKTYALSCIELCLCAGYCENNLSNLTHAHSLKDVFRIAETDVNLLLCSFWLLKQKRFNQKSSLPTIDCP